MCSCDWQKQQYFSQEHLRSGLSHWEQRVITLEAFTLSRSKLSPSERCGEPAKVKKPRRPPSRASGKTTLFHRKLRLRRLREEPARVKSWEPVRPPPPSETSILRRPYSSQSKERHPAKPGSWPASLPAGKPDGAQSRASGGAPHISYRFLRAAGIPWQAESAGI